MSKTIQTIDLFRCSEPDEQRRVTHIGMANAKEVFNKLEAHLKENNLLPDEYFLFTENNFLRNNGELPMDTADITYEVKYGDSEGIYLDINIRTTDYKQIHFAKGISDGALDVVESCNKLAIGYIKQQNSNVEEYLMNTKELSEKALGLGRSLYMVEDD